MTQTPASGPFGPVTTPPMSVAPMLTAAALCCALTGVDATPKASAIATVAAPRYKLCLILICAPRLSVSEMPVPQWPDEAAAKDHRRCAVILRHSAHISLPFAKPP